MLLLMVGSNFLKLEKELNFQEFEDFRLKSHISKKEDEWVAAIRRELIYWRTWLKRVVQGENTNRVKERVHNKMGGENNQTSY